MRKVIVFAAAAGAGLLLTGCPDPVMRDRHYIPAPADNVPVIDTTAAPAETDVAAVPETKPEVKPAFSYEPMTDAVSSGGVDSVSGSKQSAKSTSAKGGTYIVKRGDTPERIARKHKVSLSVFMKVNNLDEASARRLRIGQKLIIPGKNAIAPTPRTKNRKSAATVAPTLENGKYVVKSGDTPERIARRLKVKLSDLLQVNNLDEASARRLQIGQKLIIPGKAEVPVPVKTDVPEVTQPAVPPAPAATSEVITDTPAVQDATAQNTVQPQVSTETVTPSEVPIADTPEVSVQSQMEGVDVPADMSIADFAAQQGVSVEDLRKVNVNLKGDTLTKGSLIFVPKK
ncbi:MAG: LysM peptidoglycan-binding domain-containing protein [Lentisphaeria bacterium]|nr:LysM peptidoglycan-binding domain-containing protein [Lentisphaeria bacterium]